MCFRSVSLAVGTFTVMMLAATVPVHSQPRADQPESQVVVILDEPKTVDPSASMLEELTATVSRDFSDSSLREVVDWLQEERDLVVLLDTRALAEMGISPAEPVSDRLDGAPIYLLLNRLRSLELAWYYEDDVLHITTSEVAPERSTTVPYNVSDLLDAGYPLDDLDTTIRRLIAPDSWEDVGGWGVLSSLGDVLFVRQSDDIHRQVQGLLTALRSHARRTFVNDPIQHLAMRDKLDQIVSVDFRDTPLESAVAQLGATAQLDIRLDQRALRELGIREREPVTFRITDRRLETVLQAFTIEFELAWILRDGVLWITSFEEAENYMITAVYDVRDLCRDMDESYALMRAVKSQVAPDAWDDVGGPGSLDFAKAGTLVISQREDIHMEILTLLESYRAALRASSFRPRHVVDPNETITVYYRLHADVADSLMDVLPELIQQDTWRSSDRPEALGTIIRVQSKPESPDKGDQLLPHVVLVIQQTRNAHEEIAEVIGRVESGDSHRGFGGGMGGGGFGGGGFGGGFFNVAPAQRNHNR